jgi:hypothetical protein
MFMLSHESEVLGDCFTGLTLYKLHFGKNSHNSMNRFIFINPFQNEKNLTAFKLQENQKRRGMKNLGGLNFLVVMSSSKSSRRSRIKAWIPIKPARSVSIVALGNDNKGSARPQFIEGRSACAEFIEVLADIKGKDFR